MIDRRKFIAGSGCLISAPYFFFPKIVKAQDALTQGLVTEVNLVSSNLSMRPAGPQNGTDVAVAGGGRVFGRSIRGQADMMGASAYGAFTEVVSTSEYTRQVCSNGTGYMFTRFRKNLRNCCIPLGLVANQNTQVYAGAMTLIEGPNLVALRVLTSLLKERNYTSTQISDLCWPVQVSPIAERKRALITFGTVTMIRENNQNVYADRDVLVARSATCVLRYTHKDGTPDGGGEGALIVAGREELRYEFKYDTSILAL